MNSGLYAALTGNINAMKRLDVVSNNLANANTAGFKKDKLSFEAVLYDTGRANSLQGGGGTTPVFSGETFFTDFSQGSIQQTGNPLDVALEGNGFFEVNGPQGIAYTRQGNFKLDGNGRLVTSEGYPVSPEITIPANATQVAVGNDGTVSVYMPGENAPTTVGTLRVVDFPKPYALQKTGSALFVPADPQVTPEPMANIKVIQGALEGSNVNAISEMVQIIEASRYFEACTKVIRSFDDMAGKAANDLGKV